jgi:hypothetical protein
MGADAGPQDAGIHAAEVFCNGGYVEYFGQQQFAKLSMLVAAGAATDRRHFVDTRVGQRFA